jgi:hypothetical protein
MALATLSIDIVAKLANLEAGMQKAERIIAQNTARMDSRFQALSASLVKIGGLVAGSFSTQAVVEFLNATVAGLDALNDAADATGSTVEQLSALERVARLNGGTLDDVTDTLVKFNAALANAGKDKGIAATFTALGLSAQELRRQDPAQALLQTAQALARFDDDGNKARATQELFGKSLKDAAPFLKDLAESGRLYATVTKEQAAEAERFNKALAALNTTIGDNARAIVGEALPALNKWLQREEAARKLFGTFSLERGAFVLGIGDDDVTRLAKVTQELKRMEDSLALAVRLSKEQRVPVTPEELKDLQASVDALRERQRILSKLVNQTFPPTDGFSTAGGLPSLPEDLSAQATDFESYADRMRAAVARIAEDTDIVKLRELGAQLQELNKLRAAGLDPAIATQAQTRLLGLPTVEIPDEVRQLRDAQRTVEIPPEILAQRIDQQRQLNELLEATPLAQQEQLLRQQQLLNSAYAEGGLSTEKYAQATKLLNEQFTELDPRMREMAEQAKRAAGELEATLGDSLQATLKGDFDAIADAWANMLGRMALEAATKNLAAAIFGGAGGGAASFFGALFGGAGGGAPAAGPALASGAVLTGTTPFLASGGRVGVMAEAGPEAVVPLKRGRDGKLGIAGGAGGGTTINNYVSAGVQRSELMAALQVAMSAVESRLTQRLRAAGVA